MPQSTTTSRFGFPKPARTEEFRKLKAEPTEATTRIVFQGRNVDLPVIRVPIGLPKYRMANGRTVSLQAEHLAKNPGLRRDLFDGDAELLDAQEAQHNLLLILARQSDLRLHFENAANVQVDPILLDENGFVINGNRRLATWRELLFISPEKYGHFSHIDIAVLPHCDERDIDRLEATLQIEPDIKADYSWDAKANMMLAKRKRDGFSDKELADLYAMKEGEVVELFDMQRYAEDYLKSRNMADMWSHVIDHEYAFRKIVVARKKIEGVGKQEIFKQTAFILIDRPEDVGTRLYEAIPAILESLDIVVAKLQEEFVVQPSPSVRGLDDLFGGGNPNGEIKHIELPLADEIKKLENSERARQIIVEVLRSQKELKKDAEKASYLLECCSKAQSCLAAAVKAGLRPESNLKGVANQLDQIKIQTDKIRAYLSEHVKH